MHSALYLEEVAYIAHALDPAKIEDMARALSEFKGRIYCIGLGGSLANAMHMAADFRKLCRLDAVAPDNLAELTACANDEGWASIFAGYVQDVAHGDAIFILSVGGGTAKVSLPIFLITQWAKENGLTIFGIVGPDGGETARLGDYVIRIPAPQGRITPHTEAFQAVIWHCLVSHPLLQKEKTTW